MSESKIFLPPQNIRAIVPTDRPAECNAKCTLFRYPEKCKTAIWSLKKQRFEKKGAK